jgi:REP element-mobilizing transposase RayT
MAEVQRNLAGEDHVEGDGRHRVNGSGTAANRDPSGADPGLTASSKSCDWIMIRGMAQNVRASAVFLTWRTYGTWLPGDARGWVDERSNGTGQPMRSPDSRLEAAARGLMRHKPMTFDSGQRRVVEDAVRRVCGQRNWFIHALNVRTNHVHLVFCGEVDGDVLTVLKKEATKELRRCGMVEADSAVWSRGGSRRFVHGEDGIERVVQYVKFER